MKTKKKFIVLVTRDKYELPLYVAESVKEMAEVLKTSEPAIRMRLFKSAGIQEVIIRKGEEEWETEWEKSKN